MITPTFDVSASRRATVAPATAAPATAVETESLRYRLDVVAASTADVVLSAGGWLYDRVMAGWEVTVLLPHGCDTRALRILGVRVSDPGSVWDDTTGQSLAVSAEAFTADARVRDRVLTSLDDRLTEVALWGEGWPPGVHRVLTRAQHVLSAAARTFKGHALAAAGIGCGAVGPTETLLCEASAPVDPELIRLDR